MEENKIEHPSNLTQSESKGFSTDDCFECSTDDSVGSVTNGLSDEDGGRSVPTNNNGRSNKDTDNGSINNYIKCLTDDANGSVKGKSVHTGLPTGYSDRSNTNVPSTDDSNIFVIDGISTDFANRLPVVKSNRLSTDDHSGSTDESVICSTDDFVSSVANGVPTDGAKGSVPNRLPTDESEKSNSSRLSTDACNGSTDDCNGSTDEDIVSLDVALELLKLEKLKTNNLKSELKTLKNKLKVNSMSLKSCLHSRNLPRSSLKNATYADLTCSCLVSLVDSNSRGMY